MYLNFEEHCLQALLKDSEEGNKGDMSGERLPEVLQQKVLSGIAIHCISEIGSIWERPTPFLILPIGQNGDKVEGHPSNVLFQISFFWLKSK